MHVVTFFENGSGSYTASTYQDGSSTQQLTLFANLSPAFTNPGYQFVDWNTSSNGSGQSYADGATYSFASDLTLYAQWQAIPIAHTVTFFENASSSDTVSSFESEVSPTALTTIASLGFAKSGSTFLEWSTSVDGFGTTYADGATYSFSSDLTLYAQWTANASLAVNFVDNGGTGSVAPLSAPSGTSVVLPGGSGLSNPGYTFTGWNALANGSGTSYAVGSTITLTSNLTLYAQWTANASISVTFVDNGGTGALAPVAGPAGTAVSLPGGAALTYTGKTFTGWNTQANGSGTSYAVGSTITLTSNLTLYAQWTTSKFVVTFDADGGTASVPSEQFAAGASPFALPDATLAGSTFEGWFTAPSGGSLVGAAGASYAPTDSVTLFAQWSTSASSTSSASLVLTFAPNGGSGSLAPATVADGTPTDLPGGVFIRPGYVFEGWSTSLKGSGTVYAPGQSFTPTTSETLYAVWRRAAAVATLYGAVGDFPHFTTALTPALSRQVMRLARAIRARGCRKVELLGYTASTGLGSVDRMVSARRAEVVARALRVDLRRLHVRGVTIRASGEGSIDRRTSPVYSRVEVFLA